MLDRDLPCGQCAQVDLVARISAFGTRLFRQLRSVGRALDEALRFCDLLRSQPHCVVIRPGTRHWQIFTRLCTARAAKGNLITDAWLAALAIESGCEWITLDRDFAQFEGLKSSRPS